MSAKTWVIDGGPTRFVLCVLGLVVFIVVATTVVLSIRLSDLRESAQSSRAAAAQSATVEPGDADAQAPRPDPLLSARQGLAAWLAGDSASLSPDAAATVALPPAGSVLADGGEVLTTGDSYASVNVPLLVNGELPATATAELIWNGDSWAITNIVVA